VCAVLTFLRKQIVAIPGVSLHLAKQYIGSDVTFLWLKQYWNYWLLSWKNSWPRCRLCF